MIAGTKRRRRARSPHPGVKLKCRKNRDGRVAWRAVYVDPMTNRETAVTITGGILQLTTVEARRAWAIQLSKSLARERAAIAAGTLVRRQTPISVAIAEYFATISQRLRPPTVSCSVEKCEEVDA